MNREELLKVAKPILFNTEMVQAILDDRKNVTRRTVKQKYSDSIFEMYEGILCETEPETPPVDLGNGLTALKVRRFVECKQLYKTGDILYIRETWQVDCKNNKKYYYRANGEYSLWDEILGAEEGKTFGIGTMWKPSIHMPKEVARIFLKVTDVRVERLQRISEQEAKMEGINVIPYVPAKGKFGDDYIELLERTAREEFSSLWDSTIKKKDFDKYNWNANPWVWVIEFERLEVEK